MHEEGPTTPPEGEEPGSDDEHRIEVEEPAPEQTEGQAEPAGGGQVTLSHAEYEELKTLARERDDYLKRLQRAVADYQNLQKRIDRFRESGRETAIRSLAEEILPVADSLSLALEAAQRAEGGGDIVEGLHLVEKEFYGALAKFDILPVDAEGQKFDPHYHDAVMQQPAEGVEPQTVLRELKKGFVMGERVIRPSQVVVAAPAGEQSPPERETQV
jgi:molecular chaperone GrpE